MRYANEATAQSNPLFNFSGPALVLNQIFQETVLLKLVFRIYIMYSLNSGEHYVIYKSIPVRK